MTPEDKEAPWVRGLENKFTCTSFCEAKYKNNNKEILNYLISVDYDKIALKLREVRT